MRTSGEFSTAVRRGRRAGRRSVVLHLSLPDRPADDARVGFVVSKAVGPAVVRNRVKRRLRHLLRTRLSSLPAGSLLVVRALPAAAAGTSLEQDVDSGLAALLRVPA